MKNATGFLLFAASWTLAILTLVWVYKTKQMVETHLKGEATA